MICQACKHDVHPVQEMTPTADDGTGGRGGGFGGFVTRCPRTECGVPMMPVEPKTVSMPIDDVIAKLDREIAELSVLPSDEHISDMLAFKKNERTQLMIVKGRRDRPRPSAASIVVDETAVVPVNIIGPTKAVEPAPDDFISAMRARLVKLESEARKLRAMLAVADQTD